MRGTYPLWRKRATSREVARIGWFVRNRYSMEKLCSSTGHSVP